MSVADEIEKLAQLRASGALTEEEFLRAKERLIGDQEAPGAHAGFAMGAGGRSLRRSTTDAWLGGVCGGLADFTGLESWVWRLIFVIGLVAGGFSVLPYLLLWIFVPRNY